MYRLRPQVLLQCLSLQELDAPGNCRGCSRILPVAPVNSISCDFIINHFLSLLSAPFENASAFCFYSRKKCMILLTPWPISFAHGFDFCTLCLSLHSLTKSFSSNLHFFPLCRACVGLLLLLLFQRATAIIAEEAGAFFENRSSFCLIPGPRFVSFNSLLNLQY